ncbi:MAG: sulfite exporter TauE/SafE family protein [Planctomycetes bacterium]|nr:sulfite exporter TauE/SafE family protein [Planctomycetota bacterium]
MGVGVGLIVAGLIVGLLSGLLGIGGGLLVIPILVMLFGFTQKQAAGTSLAMLLPPIGIFAFLTYYRAGHVNIWAAVILALTFALGAWLGAALVSNDFISESVLRRVFAFFAFYAAGNMLFHSDSLTWATLKTIPIMAVAGLTYFLLRIIGRRWKKEFNLGEVFRRQAVRPIVMEFEI